MSASRGTKRVATGFTEEILLSNGKNNVLIMDGGTGSEISKLAPEALSEESWSGAAQLKIPEIVQQIHEEYVRCGASIVTTNTYGSNRHCLAEFGDRTEEANQIACAIARQAGAKFVFGSMSTHPPSFKDAVETAKLVKLQSEDLKEKETEMQVEKFVAGVSGWPSKEVELENFREQAAELKRGGVDAIALEMVKDIYHGSLVLQAAAETGMPVVLGLTIKLDDKGDTYLRDDDIRCAKALEIFLRLCPSIVAVNIMHSPAEYCSAGLAAVRTVWQGPMGVYPNNGTPLSWPEWTEGDLEPQMLVEFAKVWAVQGATLIGGCCGIGPSHIRALAEHFWSEEESTSASSL